MPGRVQYEHGDHNGGDIPEDGDKEEEDVDEHQYEDREVEEEEGLVTGVADKTRLLTNSSLEIHPQK